MLRPIALATFVLSSLFAFAAPTPILVDCGAGQSLNRTLAKLDKFTPSIVNFQGTCTEYVQVNSFHNLTLHGLPGAIIQQPITNPLPVTNGFTLSVSGSQSVTLSGFTVLALPSATSAIGIGHGSTDVLVQNVATAGPWGIFIYDASQVFLVRVNVNTSGFAAISVFDKSDVHIIGGVVHHPADAGFYAGLFVGSGHVTMQGTTIRDMQQGISVGSSGSVDVVNFEPTAPNSDVIIENPAGTNQYGVLVSDSSSLNVSSARLLISNAGQPAGFNSSAIFITNGSTLNAGASLVITGSRGQGVMVSNSSHAGMAGSTITGGAHGGLVVVNESTAGATLANPLTSISGNVTDLFCDSKSQITGASYIANTTVVQCNNILPGLYESLP
jgi:hypothetical protein